jgi:uncharacterized membrane protein YphA (DoxX/SURF4 family)
MEKTKLASIILSIALGLLFINAGLVKVSPWLNPDLHKERTSNIQSRYLPLWKSILPSIVWSGIPEEQFAQTIGVSELLSGVLLFLPTFNLFGTAVLLITMIGATYSHIATNEVFARQRPPLTGQQPLFDFEYNPDVILQPYTLTAVLAALLALNLLLRASSSPSQPKAKQQSATAAKIKKSM